MTRANGIICDTCNNYRQFITTFQIVYIRQNESFRKCPELESINFPNIFLIVIYFDFHPVIDICVRMSPANCIHIEFYSLQDKKKMCEQEKDERISKEI